MSAVHVNGCEVRKVACRHEKGVKDEFGLLYCPDCGHCEHAQIDAETMVCDFCKEYCGP